MRECKASTPCSAQQTQLGQVEKGREAEGDRESTTQTPQAVRTTKRSRYYADAPASSCIPRPWCVSEFRSRHERSDRRSR
jgi:hypothetical protein